MSGLFSKPSVPNTPPPVANPPAPTIDTAEQNRIQNDRVLRRRGRAATMLTGTLGAGSPNVATKTLLGE